MFRNMQKYALILKVYAFIYNFYFVHFMYKNQLNLIRNDVVYYIIQSTV